MKKLSKRMVLSFAVGAMLCCGMSGASAENTPKKDVSSVSEEKVVADSVPEDVLEKAKEAPVSIPVVKETKETAKTLDEKAAVTIEVVPKPEPKIVEPVKETEKKSKAEEQDNNSDHSTSTEGTQSKNNNDTSAGKEAEKSSSNVRASSGTSRSGERKTSQGVSKINGFISPVKKPVQSSGFGSRVHPITGNVKNHNGVDYAAACGTKVYAPADGTVIWADWKNGSAGNVVTIQHDGFVDKNGNPLETVISTNYYHLLKFLVNDGDYVEQGEVIAEVGSTGGSTGCHLHWELMVDGVKVDPTPYLSDEEVDSEIYTEDKNKTSKPEGEEDTSENE